MSQDLCGNCGTPLVPRTRAGRTWPGCPTCRDLWPNPKTLALVHRHRRPPPPNTTLSLTYEPNGTEHHDLVLRLGTWANRSDSYYYALDHAGGRRPDVVRSLRALLTHWATALTGCADGQAVLLPHAFHDQATGWLRCVRSGDTFHVEDGWSALEGWAIYPSDYAERAQGLTDFQPAPGFGPPLAIACTRLLADVQASLAAASP
ncbi:MAG: hypothetical protein KC613_25070 [Myxococcales bacterium]|nr:hypothetical protein [Myxococcales bacterium]MCB9523961.1 hypothetical protein [Myxococcales bacterium]